VRFLSNADVAQLLDMPVAMEALRVGYDDLRIGQATYGPRIDYLTPTGRREDYYQWGSMTGACRSYGVVAVRMKSDIVSWPDGRTQEKYCVAPGTYCGLILLFSANDGAPLAMLHDGYLQHMRVGAAIGIGTDRLARRDADTLGLLGSGGMARTFLEALALVRRPRRVRVYSPNRDHREQFAKRAESELGLPVEAVDGAEAAVRDSSIVATATDSMRPTFDPDWLSPGSHVAVVTRRELSEALLDRADRVVQLGWHTVPPGTPLPMLEQRKGAGSAAGEPRGRARQLLHPRRGRARRRAGPDERRRGDAPRRHRDPRPAIRRGGRTGVAARRRDRPGPRAADRVVPAGHP
jgi:ornithine cyclodeaminase/alanine dehydrogenase-like protein (mu-crystallin family)